MALLKKDFGSRAISLHATFSGHGNYMVFHQFQFFLQLEDSGHPFSKNILCWKAKEGLNKLSIEIPANAPSIIPDCWAARELEVSWSCSRCQQFSHVATSHVFWDWVQAPGYYIVDSPKHITALLFPLCAKTTISHRAKEPGGQHSGTTVLLGGLHELAQ